MIHINLIPIKVARDKTLDQLWEARIGAFKLIIFHLKNENRLQEQLISAYAVYVKFLERRLRNNYI